MQVTAPRCMAVKAVRYKEVVAARHMEVGVNVSLMEAAAAAGNWVAEVVVSTTEAAVS